jgi:hypothetical protein
MSVVVNEELRSVPARDRFIVKREADATFAMRPDADNIRIRRP